MSFLHYILKFTILSTLKLSPVLSFVPVLKMFLSFICSLGQKAFCLFQKNKGVWGTPFLFFLFGACFVLGQAPLFALLGLALFNGKGVLFFVGWADWHYKNMECGFALCSQKKGVWGTPFLFF
jgi:hypothetical protein